jgi:uncharacterized membrane protein YphA (DoxX/SURF4 family)
MQWIALTGRVLLGVVFLVSVSTKLRRRRAFMEFADSVRALRLVPGGLVNPVAGIVVAGEVLIIALLATPVPALAELGFAVAAAMLALFTVAIVVNVRRQTNATCRCFGVSNTPLGGVHVVRNVGLFLVALLGGLAVRSTGGSEPDESIVAVVVGLVCGGLITVLDDMRALLRPATRS